MVPIRRSLVILRDHSTRAVSVVVLAAALGVVSPWAIQAQARTLVRSTEGPAPFALIVDRPEDVVRDDLSAANALRSRFDSEIESVQDLLSEAKADVEVKKSQIKIIETERDLADERGRDAEKDALEQEKRLREAERRLLERTVDLREREVELLEAGRDRARAAVQVHERELTLVGARRDLGELDGADAGALGRIARLEQQVDDQEKELLERLRDRARRQQDEADKERRVYEAKLAIIDARRQLAEHGG